MPKSEKPKKRRLNLSNIWTGYSIILVHLFFVVALATSMIFIQALSEYFIYVLAGGLISALLLFLFIYRKLRRDGRQMVDNLQKASSRYGHDIRIDLMGGMASIAISNQRPPAGQPPLQLAGNRAGDAVEALPAPDQNAEKTRTELLRLAELYENQLISRNEFDLLKKNLLSPPEEPNGSSANHFPASHETDPARSGNSQRPVH